MRSPAAGITVRRARTPDVKAIRAFVDSYAPDRKLLNQPTVPRYEDVQEFWVATRAEVDAPPTVVGCGALHVMWEDLAEIRTLAVAPEMRGQGVGHLLLDHLLTTARKLGVHRLFCLTFEVDFFAAHGFAEIDGTPVAPELFAELLRSYDEGIAEFLDLDRVKPNTLGNTRMIMHL
jgi:amino-acid N-acetyltransferase